MTAIDERLMWSYTVLEGNMNVLPRFHELHPVVSTFVKTFHPKTQMWTSCQHQRKVRGPHIIWPLSCLNQIWWTSISGDTKAVSEQSCWSCCSEFTYFLFSSACRYVAFYSFIDITDTSKHHDRWILLFLLTTSCLNQTGYFQSVRTCLTWTVFCCVLHNCMKGKLRTISKE